MCDGFISDDPFSIRYVSDQYKSQKMCDKAVDDCRGVSRLHALMQVLKSHLQW